MYLGFIPFQCPRIPYRPQPRSEIRLPSGAGCGYLQCPWDAMEEGGNEWGKHGKTTAGRIHSSKHCIGWDIPYIHIYIYTNIYIYICILCIHTHIYIYTYTHISLCRTSPPSVCPAVTVGPNGITPQLWAWADGVFEPLATASVCTHVRNVICNMEYVISNM